MQVAIVYCSKHGATEKVVKLIGEKHNDNEVYFFNLLKGSAPEVKEFDRIIIGGPIYFGMIQNPIKDFCKQNARALLRKELGLFICCMLAEQQNELFENAFPEKLRLHSKANACFGWELNVGNLNFFEKLIVQKVANSHGGSHIDIPEIERFVNRMNSISNNHTVAH
ncbi:menaquinone-dependent protoporphyrinogen oxidase [Arcticibacter tournemirensis]|uniref:Flavodoxin n=1 Tax=Arcticibacter tournemirensis TaxID=699437 RepID=A0A5M9H1F6_9SPHI|nr:flavodoxin domain-containing protein [Arcticibacter tournemirensis]KAA8478928.1 flavodoxin [Arcticibacter tournemirensis]TQM49148.1 menaquinone-dependent protoporphyrinogen oxidase [Arcticibacter tournemirensis]